jgi:hypothetical protein
VRLLALFFALLLAVAAYLAEAGVVRPLLLAVTDSFALASMFALGPPSTLRTVSRVVLRAVVGVFGLILVVAGALFAIQCWPSLGIALVGVAMIVLVVMPEERACAFAIATVALVFAIGFGIDACTDDAFAPLGVIGALGIAGTSVSAAFARPRVDRVPRAIALA